MRFLIAAAQLALLLFLALAHSGPAPAGTRPVCGGVSGTIVRGDGDNVIVANKAPNVIYAGAGSDLIRSLGGNDVVCGGPGRDRAFQ